MGLSYDVRVGRASTGRTPRRGRGSLPKVTDYADYRRYLQEYYVFRKRADPAFSYGSFAKRAGVARSHMKGVLSGRDLTPESSRAYAKGLGLDARENEYFLLLVKANQAQGPAAKRIATGALRAWREGDSTVVMGSEVVLELCSRWARCVVLALARTPDFRADPRWIHRRLLGHVSISEATDALNFLKRFRFIRTRERRLLISIPEKLATPDSPRFEPLIVELAKRDHEVAIASLSNFGAYPDLRSWHVNIMLTASEMRALHQKYIRWLSETVPARKRRSSRKDMDLYCLMWDPVPLTAKVT